jgi:hypothetical protein
LLPTSVMLTLIIVALSVLLCSYLRGLGQIQEYMIVFCTCWLLFAPFIIFQALLSARDDYQQDFYGHGLRHKAPSATEVVAPILIVLGWLWIVATVVSFKLKTPYQVPSHLILCVIRCCLYFCFGVPYDQRAPLCSVLTLGTTRVNRIGYDCTYRRQGSEYCTTQRACGSCTSFSIWRLQYAINSSRNTASVLETAGTTSQTT